MCRTELAKGRLESAVCRTEFAKFQMIFLEFRPISAACNILRHLETIGSGPLAKLTGSVLVQACIAMTMFRSEPGAEPTAWLELRLSLPLPVLTARQSLDQMIETQPQTPAMVIEGEWKSDAEHEKNCQSSLIAQVG